MLGSTQQMVGTHGKGLFPAHNLVESNIVDTVGVYGKQTSAYFKAKSRENVVRNNVFMNGPRAGVNFNDGSAGGEILEGNLIMNCMSCFVLRAQLCPPSDPYTLRAG